MSRTPPLVVPPQSEREITLDYGPKLFLRWTEGNLRKEWFERYKDDLFCERDLSNAMDQPHGHFGEWYTAIYYRERGWKVLLESHHNSQFCVSTPPLTHPLHGG